MFAHADAGFEVFAREIKEKGGVGGGAVGAETSVGEFGYWGWRRRRKGWSLGICLRSGERLGGIVGVGDFTEAFEAAFGGGDGEA